MKLIKKLVYTIGLAGLTAAANAQVYTFISEIPAGDGSIPDQYENGTTFKIDTTYYNGAVNTIDGTVSSNSFRVNLNIEGDSNGANGDLYVTLYAPSGEMAVLLNRVGFGEQPYGYGDNGLNITLFDGIDPANSSITDVHWYQNDPLYSNNGNQVTGIYKTDGRSITPDDVNASLYASAARDKSLTVFEGINPNGEWTLFIADMGSTGLSALKSWGLDFTPIPEPSQYAMVVGAGLMAFGFYRNRMRKTA